MKDLCELGISNHIDEQQEPDARPSLEGSLMSETKKIKSFHRRGRAPQTVPTGPIAVEPPAMAIERTPEVLLEPEAKLPARDPSEDARTPVWSRLRVGKIDAAQVVRRALPLVDRFRDTESAKAIDLLRTRLLHTLRAQGWRRVAIAAPTSGCGATWMTVNLAQGLARVPNSRTIVMDMNFRKPNVAGALALSDDGDMVGFLSGRVPAHRHLMRLSDGLSVGLNRAGKVSGSEILQNPTTGKAIDAMMTDSRADVALFDLPPVLEHDDLTAFLPQVDGVLLVADGTRTTAKDLAACEKILAGHTQLLGVVLNRARAD